MRTLTVIVLGLALGSCAFLISGITSAYSGTFYTTGRSSMKVAGNEKRRTKLGKTP